MPIPRRASRATDSRNASYELRYGSYEDSDDKWIKKEPSFVYKYARPLGKTHLNYSFDVEWGRWHKKENDITSTHRYYGLTLSRDPIFLGGGWYISPSITSAKKGETKLFISLFFTF